MKALASNNNVGFQRTSDKFVKYEQLFQRQGTSGLKSSPRSTQFGRRHRTNHKSIEAGLFTTQGL